HAPLGSDPDRPGTRRAAPARRARGGNAPRVQSLRHGRSLRAPPSRVLGGESVGGIPPVGAASHCLGSRLCRLALLVSIAPVVPPQLPRPPQSLGARA